MNVLSTRPLAASFFCLALASCHPFTAPDPHVKTVVWDVHGAPPASGHALLIQPAAPNDGMSTTPWTPLSDTLLWDLSTGELDWPHVPLDAWWHIESSDPYHPGSMRSDRFPAFTDTCHMTSHTTLHLSGKMHGTVHVPAHQEAQWETNGHVNWRGSSRLWLGSQGALHCDGNDTGLWTLAGPVAWQGPGHAHLKNLKAFWLSEGHLHATCRTTLEDCDLTAEDPAAPSLFSEGRMRISHSKVGGLFWEHQGQGDMPASTSAFFAEDSQWEDCQLTLSDCPAQVADNDFVHSPVRIESPQTPFKITGNTLQAPWHVTTPTLSLSHGEGHLVWLENNIWLQGLGLHLHHTSATLKCNTWLDCGAGAIHIEGVAPACMASACGGGGNVFDQNAWHVVLSDAPLPHVRCEPLGMGP